MGALLRRRPSSPSHSPLRRVRIKSRQRSRGRSRSRELQRRQHKARQRSSSASTERVARSQRTAATSAADSSKDRSERASRLALAIMSGLRLRKASKSVARERTGEKASRTPRKRYLSVASPLVMRSRRRAEDPEGDWSRELRAWSPERRAEQARRRVMAEEFLKAKEEEVEEEEQQQQPLEVKRIRRRKRKSLKASSQRIEQSSPSAVNTGSMAPDDSSQTLKDLDLQHASCTDQTVNAENPDEHLSRLSPRLTEQRCRTSLEKALLASLMDREVVASSIDDICWSDVEELLDQHGKGVETVSSSEDSDMEIHPPEEVARLLDELAASATGFDARDYFDEGVWDLEGLREDVEQLHQERRICEEKLRRTQAGAAKPDQSGTTDCNTRIEPRGASPQRSDSPELDYPIFVRPQPLNLAPLEPLSAIVAPRSDNRHSFAKRRRKPVSDMILAWQLRRLLSNSEPEVLS